MSKFKISKKELQGKPIYINLDGIDGIRMRFTGFRLYPTNFQHFCRLLTKIIHNSAKVSRYSIDYTTLKRYNNLIGIKPANTISAENSGVRLKKAGTKQKFI